MNKNPITWQQLIVVIGVVGTIFGFVWQAISHLQEDVTRVRINVAEVKTDVGWLRGQWEKMTGQGEVSLRGNLLDRMYESK
jgi:hypothetical protein